MHLWKHLIPSCWGERVILARLRREDIPEITRYFQNLELTTYLGGSGVSYSLEDEQAYFESVSRSSAAQVTFGVYERESGRVIGGIDLRDINHRHGTAELGVSIHDPACWSGGFGSEATRLMVQYGVFHLGLHNILLRVFAFNTRAIRAYEKVGFQVCGRRTGTVRLGDQRYDTIFMEITADRVDTSALEAQITLLE
ncbi:GNAT family N-acetyltransferase [Deinococcus metallilatus]|uniref:RimJ/RimL family protein N-acetyltransferase n=1 Tax=Deinococcus metallilatus TaxID=1211322 RepID=A0ABR6MS34_9DEIO|nr:GNAT family N-acetyltransferase [Deinococcus metallilatus]MBB5294719.1 RimJ/RimL family protein N-acetyltransferase [Deinococcus metallilatus]